MWFPQPPHRQQRRRAGQGAQKAPAQYPFEVPVRLLVFEVCPVPENPLALAGPGFAQAALVGGTVAFLAITAALYRYTWAKSR